jgi:tetratricopeptide (TPR) repeat protein
MTEVRDSRGVQAGDHNVQINLFVGERPQGPVVAGNVPQAPPAFQARADLVAQLRARSSGVSVVRAVTGMRGVGKTQLAAAYARECIDEGWRLVAWINAEDSASILTGLEVVASRLGIDRPGTDLELIAGEVRNRVEADGDKCLIVYDNVTDPHALRPYLPSAGKSRVVVTSTQASTLALGPQTEVTVFTLRESVDFLAERTGLRDPQGAMAVAVELGHLPLALAQAAAVMKARHLTYDVYRTRLRSYPAQRHLPPAKGDQYPHGVAESILLSVDTVAVVDGTGLGAGLLGVISLLSPDGVPRDMLYLGESIEVLGFPDEAAIDEVLAHLADASLLTYGGDDESNPTVSAHRVVMRVVRDSCERDGTLPSLGAKACAVLAAGARALGEPWRDPPKTRGLVKQVISLNDHLAKHTGADAAPLAEALLDIRVWALWCLHGLGDSSAQAIEFGEFLIADCARVLGESHRYTLRSRGNLACAYDSAGRWREAIPLHERTLADRERILGDAHPDTLLSRSNLAFAYQAVGRLDEAIRLYERTLADRERILGRDHLDTLLSRNNLAGAYEDAGRFDDAISLHERALASYIQLRGDDHPDTARARNNLAAAYEHAGQLDEAIPLLERATADRERMLGPDHPDTSKSRGNLALAYGKAGRLDEAVALHERALGDRERVLGEDHPETLLSRDNLALAYRAVGRLDEAIVLHERVVADSVLVLGDGHPDALIARNNLAAAYLSMGRFGEAIPLFEQAVAGLEPVLGANHPDMALIRGNLAFARQEAVRQKANRDAFPAGS